MSKLLCAYMWYIRYCYCIAGHSLPLGALMYLKTKTLQNVYDYIFYSAALKSSSAWPVWVMFWILYPFRNLQQ